MRSILLLQIFATIGFNIGCNTNDTEISNNSKAQYFKFENLSSSNLRYRSLELNANSKIYLAYIKVTSETNYTQVEKVFTDSCYLVTKYAKINDSIVFENNLFGIEPNRLLFVDEKIKHIVKSRNCPKEKDELVEYKSKSGNQISFTLERDKCFSHYYDEGYILKKNDTILMKSKSLFLKTGFADPRNHHFIVTKTNSTNFEELKKGRKKDCM